MAHRKIQTGKKNHKINGMYSYYLGINNTSGVVIISQPQLNLSKTRNKIGKSTDILYIKAFKPLQRGRIF